MSKADQTYAVTLAAASLLVSTALILITLLVLP
jgi:hypothetical protein